MKRKPFPYEENVTNSLSVNMCNKNGSEANKIFLQRNTEFSHVTKNFAVFFKAVWRLAKMLFMSYWTEVFTLKRNGTAIQTSETKFQTQINLVNM